MTVSPFLDAPLLIQIHATCATIALVTGPVALWRNHRDRLHRSLGCIWVIAMAMTALSAFFIHSFPLIGPFSPVHLLAVLALWSLWFGMRAILRGDIAGHRAAMRGLFLRGLMVAALFNFLPERLVNRSIFPNAPEIGYIVIAIGLGLLAVQALITLRARGGLVGA